MEKNIKERYGFVGIGSMGGNVATTFHEKGYSILVVNTAQADLDSLNGYTSALKAPVRCFGNHLSGKRKSWFRTDNDCGGAAILKTRTSRMGTPVGC